MSRPSEYVVPLLVTAVFSAAAPIAYALLWTDSPAATHAHRANLYIVESPMGRWVAEEKPSVHLNGTVSFRDAENGHEMTIDNGGVVIRPDAQQRN